MASTLTSFSLAFPISGVTASPELSTTPSDEVRYPVSNSADFIHPLRTTRFSVASYPTVGNLEFSIYYNIPTGVTIAGAFVDNCNYTGSVLFQSTAADGTSPSNFTLVDSNLLTKDSKTGRIKGYFRFVTPRYFDGTTEAKMRFTTNGGTIDASYGITTAAVGSVCFFEETKEISYPGGFINDIEYDIVVPQIKSAFETGSYETAETGEVYVTVDIPDRIFYETQETEILNLILKKTSPMVFWENEGDQSRAYIVKLNNESTKLKYKVRGRAFEAAVSFIELI